MQISCDKLTGDLTRLKCFSDQSQFNQQRTERKQSIDNSLELNRIKIKIILNSPNLILDALNDSDILTAAVLFRRTRYLCDQFKHETSFTTLIHHTIFLDKIYILINQKYLDATNYHNLNDQQLLRILFAICLIKEESFVQVILDFLSNRKLECIELFNSSNDSKNACSTNDKLLNFFKIIFSTLEIVFNLYNSIDEITAPLIVGHINAITIDYEFLNRNEQKVIKEIFSGFKIEKFIKEDSKLIEQIEHAIYDWFEKIKLQSNVSIQAYLQTTSIDTLYESLNEVKKYFDFKETLILKCHYYKVICKREIDFRSHFLFVPIKATWQFFLASTINRLFQNLKNKIQYLNEEEDSVLNISEYIWSNDLNDLNEMHKKYCGTTERIIELINQTNEEFNYLLDKFLLAHKQIELIATNQQQFKCYFYEIFAVRNDEFLAYVDNLIKSNQIKREQNFNLAHLIRMLVLICPNYKQCFDILNLQSWFKTKDHLLALAYAGYNSYINQIIDDLVQLFYEELDRNQPLNCLHISANWLEIEIKESIDGGGQEEMLTTKIYIPKQISLPLEHLLTSLTIRLCRLSGHTLPNKLKLMILDELISKLCTGYRKLYDSMQLKSIKQAFSATQTLQIYFDLLFLKNLFYHSLNDEHLRSELANVLNCFQQEIDPFDLHLFTSYLQINLEHNKSSLGMILNYLLPQNLQIVNSSTTVTNLNSSCIKERNFKFNLL